MFTGIIEQIGEVRNIQRQGSNITFTIASSISNELKIDQSVAHNGVCLTVVDVSNGAHQVTAIDETLQKTNLGDLRIGDKVNLERCLKIGDRLDGHMVQGHVDQTAVCKLVTESNGSWLYTFEFLQQPEHVLVEKGSVCLNGISLTVFDVSNAEFKVAIIPYTYTHTNMHRLAPGSVVNIEFDVIGKYVARILHK